MLNHKSKECPECKGKGYGGYGNAEANYPPVVIKDCPTCNGTGVLPMIDPTKPKDILITNWHCDKCDGTGKVKDVKP